MVKQLAIYYLESLWVRFPVPNSFSWQWRGNDCVFRSVRDGSCVVLHLNKLEMMVATVSTSWSSIDSTSKSSLPRINQHLLTKIRHRGVVRVLSEPINLELRLTRSHDILRSMTTV